MIVFSIWIYEIIISPHMCFVCFCFFFPSDSPSAVTALANPSRGITEGATLRLACCSPAESQANVTWHKSTSNSVTHTGQVWNITEVKSDDSGSYYCQMQTGAKVHNSTILPVDVQCKSSFCKNQINIYIQGHSSVYLLSLFWHTELQRAERKFSSLKYVLLTKHFNSF